MYSQFLVLIAIAVVTASPLFPSPLPACLPTDPIVVAFKGIVPNSPALSYCSSLLQKTTVKTTTTTPYATLTLSTQTTDTTTTLIQTSVSKSTKIIGTTTTTITTTHPGGNPFKRQVATNAPTVPLPAPLKAFATSQLSSVCSCFITASTLTITTTATAATSTATTVSTTHVTATRILTSTIVAETDITAVTTSTACAVATGNVVKNGGFESGNFSSWFTTVHENADNPDNTRRIVSPGGSNGSEYFYRGQIRAAAAKNPFSYNIIFQQVNLCKGQNYNISYDLQFVNSQNDSSCTAALGVEFKDGTGWYWPITGDGTGDPPTSDWQTFTGNFTTESDTTFVYLSQQCDDNQNIDMYMDNAIVSPM